VTQYYEYGVIPKFDEEYFFLSNFYPYPFYWRGVEFPTVEHAFQYAKGFHSSEPDQHFDAVLNAPTPSKAKSLGRVVNINLKAWDERKVWYMQEMIKSKFSEGEMISKLTSTGWKMLVEGNDWGDDFWGRCNIDGKMVGLNTLGVLLMHERGYWMRGKDNEQ
jgi:hypothetical protein